MLNYIVVVIVIIFALVFGKERPSVATIKSCKTPASYPKFTRSDYQRMGQKTENLSTDELTKLNTEKNSQTAISKSIWNKRQKTQPKHKKQSKIRFNPTVKVREYEMKTREILGDGRTKINDDMKV